jgi:hypothetical protein
MIFNLKCLGIVLLSLACWILMPSLLVRAAPVPKAADKKGVVSVKELKELLGKDHLSDEVFEIRKRLGKTCKVTYYGRDYGYEPRFFHTWHKHGIELKFNEKGHLEAIFLYSEGAKSIDGVFKQYLGELPNGLDFNDEPKDVVRKLGEPDEAIGQTEASYSYPKLGLNVNFRTVKREGERSTISNITIYLPEKN